MRVEILTTEECLRVFEGHIRISTAGSIDFGFSGKCLTYLPHMQIALGGKIFKVKNLYTGYGETYYDLEESGYTVADWMVKNFYLSDGKFMGGAW